MSKHVSLPQNSGHNFRQRVRSGYQHARQAPAFRKLYSVAHTTRSSVSVWSAPAISRVRSHIPNPLINFLRSRRVQVVFFLLLIVIGMAILLFPKWPAVYYWLHPPQPDVINYQIPADKAAALGNIKSTVDAKAPPPENRLVIPKIGVDSQILEWADIYVLSIKEGVWRDVETKNPEQIGNMVIAGHRFQYAPPNTNTFYNLDQLIDGDKIIVFWNQTPYIYQVYQTLTVDPSRADIKLTDPGVPHELTLYTCTPLYSSAQRLVVKAKLVS